MKISIVSGGFDPLHSGHLAYLEDAANLGDELWVCLNSDEWLTKKKGKPFMSFNERSEVLEALGCVDKVIGFDDSDGSCTNGLLSIAKMNPKAKLVFCNGGDRTIKNIPEKGMENLELVFGVGGVNKKNSSSSLLENWYKNEEYRKWGSYSVLFNNTKVKVKELSIEPNNGMSFQRHFEREEIWFIHSGSCKVYLREKKDSTVTSKILKQGALLRIPVEAWHQITNPYNKVCKIIEIQFGTRVEEDDIERQFFFPEVP